MNTESLKTEVYKQKPVCNYDKVRYLAAINLRCLDVYHDSDGTFRLSIFDLPLQFDSGFDIVTDYDSKYGTIISDETIKRLNEEIGYPHYCKQKVFSMHVGITIPRLKKLLSERCYEQISDPFPIYRNKKTNYIVVNDAIEELEKIMTLNKTPISQEIHRYDMRLSRW